MSTDDQLEAIIARLQYLEDRQAILDVVASQARGHDRHDADLMTACFHEDGIDEHGQFVNSGPDYAAWANAAHSGGFTSHNHHITNQLVEIDGDTAHAESYVIGTFLLRQAPGRARFIWGRYVDRLEKREGTWRILVRRSLIDGDMEAQSDWEGGEINGTFPRGAWDETDLSFTRPLEISSPSPRWDGTSR